MIDRLSLRTALILNALFSTGTGLLLTIAPGSVGGWLGIDLDGWLRLLGVVLIAHGAALRWVLTQDDLRMWGRLDLAGIAPYPIAMAGLVVTRLIDRPLGIGLVLTDGAIVAALALLHWQGLKTHGVQNSTAVSV